RDAMRTPKEVPQRRLERPITPGVKRDRLERAGVRRQGEWVAADEQMLELLKPGHRVTRADSGHTRISLHADDRRDERRAGIGVPGRVERRIELEAQPLDADCGDLHLFAAVERVTYRVAALDQAPGGVGVAPKHRGADALQSCGTTRDPHLGLVT